MLAVRFAGLVGHTKTAKHQTRRSLDHIIYIYRLEEFPQNCLGFLLTKHYASKTPLEPSRSPIFCFPWEDPDIERLKPMETDRLESHRKGLQEE